MKQAVLLLLLAFSNSSTHALRFERTTSRLISPYSQLPQSRLAKEACHHGLPTPPHLQLPKALLLGRHSSKIRKAVLGAVSLMSSILLFTTTAPLPSRADSGLAVVTDSEVGKLVRYGVIRGAQTVDKADEVWERFSDRLRDKNNCDAVTGRRLFDNGFRKDGSRLGNPVLGNLCKPQPLKSLNLGLAQVMLDTAEEAAELTLGTSKEALRKEVEDVSAFIKPAFERAADGLAGDERARKDHNSKVFIQFRAFSKFTSAATDADAGPNAAAPTSDTAGLGNRAGGSFGAKDGRALTSLSTTATAQSSGSKAAAFEEAWGKALFEKLSKGNRGRLDYSSPFPAPAADDLEEDEERLYDEGKLLDALGALSASFRTLEKGGLIGHWEISIPADDDGSVVTVAVDDDVTLGAQFLLFQKWDNSFTPQQKQSSLKGSGVQALVKAALESSGITCRMDAYFLDPSTTKQGEYEPTQLLISMRNLRGAVLPAATALGIQQ